MSLKALKKALDDREVKIKEKELELAAEEVADEAFERAYRARRAKDRAEREKVLAKIVAWVNKFVKTKEYRKLIDQISKGEVESCIGLYHGGYGHCPDPANNGCWSDVVLKKGKLVYRSGYKWMGGNNGVDHDNFVDLELEYLKKFLEHIESGKVYDTIIATTKP